MLLPSFVIPDAGGSPPVGYQLTNSLRFNGSSSRMTTAIMGASTNPIKWTWNGWVKRGKLSVAQNIFGNGATTSAQGSLVRLQFLATDTIQFLTRNTSAVVQSQYETVKKFRDTSAFYNIGIIYDAAQTNADDRFKMFINGVELIKGVDLTVTNPVDLNATPPTPFETSKALGVQSTSAAWAAYLDGIIAAACFVDGQALVPDGHFGEFNANGRFVPIDPTEVITDFGKNGSRLLFNIVPADTTVVSLGNDSAPLVSGGNHTLANNWTLSGFTHDGANSTANECSLTCSPTKNINGGNNLEYSRSGGVGAWSITEMKLTLNSTTVWGAGEIAIDPLQKIYAEVTCTSGIGSAATNKVGMGIVQQTDGIWTLWAGVTSTGKKVVNGVESDFAPAMPAFANGAIICMAIDAPGDSVSFWNSTAPTVKYTIDISAIPQTGLLYIGAEAMGGSAGARVLDFNFGQRKTALPIPDGFSAQTPSTDATVVKSGSFTGTANVNGPFIFMNGTPETFSVDTGSGLIPVPTTSYDKLANGVKIRVSTGPNVVRLNDWSATVLTPEAKSAFINRNAQVN
jgi:hypothetical protein